MKLNFGKKLVLFLHWLLSLLFCALAIALCIWPESVAALLRQADHLMAGWGEIAGIALLAVYALLAVLSIVFIFSGKKKRADRSFITVDSSETGKTRIAISAVEQMIRQAVRGVEGIVDMKSSIINNEDAISINASVSISAGAHVPTVTMNIQRAVRSYIELNCGVAVREICVSVNALEGEDGGKQNRRRGFTPAPAAVQEYTPVEAPAPIIPEPEAAPVQEDVQETAAEGETEATE